MPEQPKGAVPVRVVVIVGAVTALAAALVLVIVLLGRHSTAPTATTGTPAPTATPTGQPSGGSTSPTAGGSPPGASPSGGASGQPSTTPRSAGALVVPATIGGLALKTDAAVQANAAQLTQQVNHTENTTSAAVGYYDNGDPTQGLFAMVAVKPGPGTSATAFVQSVEGQLTQQGVSGLTSTTIHMNGVDYVCSSGTDSSGVHVVFCSYTDGSIGGLGVGFADPMTVQRTVTLTDLSRVAAEGH